MSQNHNGSFSVTPLVHPDRYKDFKRYAVPRDQVKETGQHLAARCHNPACGTVRRGSDSPFQVCGKCKIAAYCSKDCQRQDWPAHKLSCTTGNSCAKLLKKFIANEVLMGFIHMYGSLELNLLNTPPRNEHDVLDVRVKLSPADTAAFMEKDLQNGNLTGMQGMLQVDAIYTRPKSILEPNVKEVRDKLRKNIDELAPDYISSPIFMAFFSSDGQQGMWYPILVPPSILDEVGKAAPFQAKSVLFGEYTIPFGKEGIIDFINNYIRSDVKNRSMLRAKFTQIDVDTFLSPKRNKRET